MQSSFIVKALLAWALVVSALAASAAGAHAGWTSNGPLSGVSATAGASTFTISAPGGAVGVSCSGSTLSGGTLAGPTGPASGSWDWLNDVTLGFSGCTVAGFSTPITCNATAKAKVRLAVYTSGTDAAGGVMANITCVIRPPVFPNCTITISASGSLGAGVSVNYRNALGLLGILTAGQTLTGSWTNCPFINPPSGSGVVSWGALTYGFISIPKPWGRWFP